MIDSTFNVGSGWEGEMNPAWLAAHNGEWMGGYSNNGGQHFVNGGVLHDAADLVCFSCG